MTLESAQRVVIDGKVVQVTERGDSVFRAAGVWYSSFSGAEIGLNWKPFGKQRAFKTESRHDMDDLAMDGPEWMPLDGRK